MNEWIQQACFYVTYERRPYGVPYFVKFSTPYLEADDAMDAISSLLIDEDVAVVNVTWGVCNVRTMSDGGLEVQS